jgi:3-methyladenine DNA glycosylase AlkC
MADDEKKAFKDWFDKDAAAAMAAQMASAWPGFDRRRFCRLALVDIDKLEFNQRVGQFSAALAQVLPVDYHEAIKIIIDSLPPPLPDCEAVTDGWLQWPVGQFIADHGIDHFEPSMTAMQELTRRFSAEFAVRPFMERYPDETLERLQSLTGHECPHVRRWCSEGTRTRLPWGRRLTGLIKDPAPVWPILEALKDDPELYVRRSVANNLNDLSKDHPESVLDLVRRWSDGASDERQWVVKHALRGLVKQGNADALAIVGYAKPVKLEATLKVTPKKIVLGESVQLQVELYNDSRKAQSLLVDYVVHYVRKSGVRKSGVQKDGANSGKGKVTGEKVFKWKTLTLKPQQRIELTKKHPMRATTIRALYAGTHQVELQINGYRMGADNFQFSVPPRV